MAFGGSRLCCFFCRNLPFIDYMEDELAKDPGPAEDFHLDSTSPALSCNPTLGPTLIPALISAPISTSASTLPSSDKLFNQFMKVYLEFNPGPK